MTATETAKPAPGDRTVSAEGAPTRKDAALHGDGQRALSVLSVDVGGTHVKILANNVTDKRRRFASGPHMTAEAMVAQVRELAADWKYDVATIGYPGPVVNNRVIREPYNLGPGWVDFDFEAALGCPVKVMNDAAMQALGSYDGRKMLFLSFGTGLGSTLIVEGKVVPMELGHLPYKKATFEDYVGKRGLATHGKRKWRADVTDVTDRLIAALLPDDVVLGGGNVTLLDQLPPLCRAGANANAFVGGFRAWAVDHRRDAPAQPLLDVR